MEEFPNQSYWSTIERSRGYGYSMKKMYLNAFQESKDPKQSRMVIHLSIIKGINAWLE